MSEMETSVSSVWTTRIESPVAIDVRTLPGKALIDHAGHKVGKITGVELDHKTGRTDFMKIRRGGFLGYGTEWYLEPIDRISDVHGNTVTME